MTWRAAAGKQPKKAILNREADLIILDEINIVLQTGMLPVDEVVEFFLRSIRVMPKLSAPGAAHRRSCVMLPGW